MKFFLIVLVFLIIGSLFIISNNNLLIYEEGGLSNFIEAIALIKILGQYYIDSVEIAG